MSAESKKMKPTEIKELMRLKDWTQAELARQMEVTDGAITRWLKGQELPGMARVLLRSWLEQARKEAKTKKEKQPA